MNLFKEKMLYVGKRLRKFEWQLAEVREYPEENKWQVIGADFAVILTLEEIEADYEEMKCPICEDEVLKGEYVSFGREGYEHTSCHNQRADKLRREAFLKSKTG